ncbi:hypothetical protein BJX63DRAFT_392536 [Aspergillus granulosus]|uniref:PD-(D/E)XK nuclease-like domain-containing protein n=1 Tax=Aspergillus granulosus TaxID=176169 RepID=A0ABR4HG99_9EURO
MKEEDIIKWVSQVHPLASASTTASALYPNPTKNQHQLPSPPESRKRHQTMPDGLNPTSKRQRIEEDVIEVNKTPRASSSRRRRPYLPAPTASQEFVRCNTGIVGFISNNLQAEIKEQSKQDPSFDIFGDAMFTSPGVRDQLGPTPSFKDVAFITKEAKECQKRMQSEAGWNMFVYYPLLYKAIYGERKHEQKQLVGFTPCTTARIIREYLPIYSQAKMVDFCIYVEPEMDDIAFNATSSLRKVLPNYVINHTDFPPIRNSPIAISIETKRQCGAQPATAELQIGTWHAAQWNLLEDLIARSGGLFDGLSFLPAIIVEGHDWSFAATTREDQKTVLWLEQRFGSTNDVVGVYKTIWGLQRLAKWASEVYWPWFRKNALGVSEETDDV